MDTTRRSFLMAGTVGAVAPFIIADDKTGTKNPILGEGEHKYECIHDWGELPSNIKYGNTHSVCEDAQGHIYVHHTVHKDSPSPDSVVVFDEKGKFVRSWGPMFRGGAHGMFLRKEGKTEYLYFCDEKHGIVTKRNLKGEEVWTMGYPQASPIYQKGPGSTGPGGANGLNYRPTNISMAPNGDFWIGDGYGSYYMFHYKVDSPTSYPKLVNVFGGPAPTPAPARGGGGRGPGGGGRAEGGARGGGAPGGQAEARGGAPGGGRGAGGGRGPRTPAPLDQMNNPHGNMVDLRDPNNPVHLIADRGHGRIVRYTLDDKPIDVVEGTVRPCYFHGHKDLIVVPDLSGPVFILDKDNKVAVTMGTAKPDGPKNPPRTTENRGDFVPGQFVAPHGATFDHNGNIFVAEWVEIGRVTKLRKVA
ncbi:MAG TPA: hypothetical protein VHY84_15545 [Bryobacteraceae bacterium]|jgi:hypothetical protein|nr:hypothetical protein [Bryobacteraceae bacterium]